jgi:acyl-CoA thioesterase
MSEPPALEIARRCVATMWAEDRASVAMGMRLVAVGVGRAEVAMVVTETMVNGWGRCHGGYLASLADTAFAAACNTYDEVTVAAGFDISFVVACVVGDELTARATERVRRGRTGIYDVRITRTDGDGGDEVVAEMRGRSHSLGQPILEGG